MELKLRDASVKTVEDVIKKNFGVEDIKDIEGKSSYRIDGLQKAADMIKEAISKKQLITIVGDYDADGVTSSSIMYYTLSYLGAIVRVRIPKRLSEGFGLNMNIIDEIDSGLIITVDNGIVAFDPIKKAKELGLSVIVTDHHLPAEDGTLPEADLIIDPHLPGTADFEDYCGAGIAFRLAKELVDDETVINKMSAFAAIGTIADVMPLVEENRQIVKMGLKNMTTYGCRTSGLYSVLKAVDMDKNLSATDVAFKIGPMINAVGRLFDDGAKIAFESLVYDDKFDESIGTKLNEYNELRKKKVEDGVKAVEKNIKDNCLFGDVPLIVYEPSIEEGIVGIIAGKLAEKNNVPSFVFTDSEEPGIYKGSGRTGGQVHLKDLLDSCAETVYKYGGHAEAAGVSVEASKFSEFCEKMQENCPELVIEEENSICYYDLEINASDIKTTVEELKKYEPYGQGNPKPVFYIKNFQMSPRYGSLYKTLGKNGEHLKLFGIGCSAIGFGMVEEYHTLGDPNKLDLVGVISENYFMGKADIQVEIQAMDSALTAFSKSILAETLETMAKTRY